jgi:uncharacterized membrane protein
MFLLIPLKLLQEVGLFFGFIGTLFLAQSAFRSKFRKDKGGGASLGSLPKLFGESEDRRNLWFTRGGIIFIGLGFLLQLVAILDQP